MKIKTKNNISHWDCRETAKNYVNTTSVLAGFAFTAIILVLDKNNDISRELQNLKDWACIGFTISFFGFIVSSFTFSIVSGEGNINSRAFTMMLIGGCGLSVSAGFLMWGIVLLMKVFSQSEISEVSSWIFLSSIILSLLYLIYVVIDIFYVFEEPDKQKLKKIDLSKLFIGAFAPIVCATLVKLFDNGYFSSVITIKQVAILSVIVISFSGANAVRISNLAEDYKISINQSSTWIAFHSLIFCVLILLLP